MKYAVLLLALMFVGVATPSMAQMLTFKFERKTIEVAKEDSPEQLNWDDAMSACQNLGNGWRLPNIDELMAIYEQLHTKGKGNFRTNVWYWSSSARNANNAWNVYFGDGKASSYSPHKYTERYVRAVRTLP